MAEPSEFFTLAKKGLFEQNALGGDLYELAPGAEVSAFHNGKCHKVLAFKGPNAREDRNTVRFRSENPSRYRVVPMRYVWIDPDLVKFGGIPLSLRESRKTKKTA